MCACNVDYKPKTDGAAFCTCNCRQTGSVTARIGANASLPARSATEAGRKHVESIPESGRCFSSSISPRHHGDVDRRAQFGADRKNLVDVAEEELVERRDIAHRGPADCGEGLLLQNIVET